MKPITEKPKKPVEPYAKDFPRTTPVDEFNAFVVAYRKYQRELEKYEKDLEIYEQTKLIRFVKNADIKLILRKYKITKR